MTISLAQTASLTCPVCGVAFDAEVWLIVAADERPDLVARIRAGTLHTVVCPNGHASQIDAPLLLYRPDADPPILFSPAEQTTREQDQQQAAGLIGALREQLGNAWRDAWLVQGLPGVQRAMLPIALADDPEAALHAAQAQMQQALDELRERDPDAFAQLEAEAQQMMETTDAPDATPGDTGDIADIPAVPPLVETLNAFISARSWMDSYRQVQAHPELLSDEALAFLDQAITAAQAQGNSNAVAIYTEHRDLLRRCREIGTDAAFAEKMNVPVAQLQDQQAPGNLPPDVQAVLAELAREGPITSPEELERRLAARPDLRERLERAAGETAGAMHIPPEVQPVIAKIAQLNRVSEMLQRVALCRQALTLIVPATHPQLWAALQGELGNSLAQNPLGERAENLEQAIAAYEQALTVMTRAAMP
ncbi:CpXC domain-containing protein, partial [Candidatus Chloroploca sp. Khr17]|uniref:CpXC domain-containing protein n=1 Tax=Candidatus Chloroploca sp. Khr17 TaxID=2496869 RepID=UPI0013E9C7AE